MKRVGEVSNHFHFQQTTAKGNCSAQSKREFSLRRWIYGKHTGLQLMPQSY